MPLCNWLSDPQWLASLDVCCFWSLFRSLELAQKWTWLLVIIILALESVWGQTLSVIYISIYGFFNLKSIIPAVIHWAEPDLMNSWDWNTWHMLYDRCMCYHCGDVRFNTYINIHIQMYIHAQTTHSLHNVCTEIYTHQYIHKIT